MKIRFIINPTAGTGKHIDIENLLAKELDPLLFQYDVYYTLAPKDAIKKSKESASEGFDIVVAVGGDGTMNECAQSLVNTPTALGIIPCGSGNGLAFHLGMKKNIKKSIQQLNHCHFKKIDSCTANGHYFFNVSGTGFDAHIAHLFNKENKRGFSNYIRLILREFRYPVKKYTLLVDHQEQNINAFVISWANGSQFGNNATIAPESKIDDGLLDICFLNKFPIRVIPILLRRLFNKTIHHSRYMKIIRCKEIQIKGVDGNCHLDGEPINLGEKIHLKVIPKSLTVFTPNG